MYCCFVQGNYVLSNDSLLEHERPQYDTILALSVTKWVSLHYIFQSIYMYIYIIIYINTRYEFKYEYH